MGEVRNRAATTGGLIKSSYQLRPDQVNALDLVAREKGLTRSGVVRQLIDLSLRHQLIDLGRGQLEKLDAFLEGVA